MTTVRELKDKGYRVYVSHRRPAIGLGEYDEKTGHIEQSLLTRHEVKEFIEQVKEVTGGLEMSFNDVVLPNGGLTTVTICRPGEIDSAHTQPEDDAVIATGEAKCSMKDVFNKKLGLQIALGRAMKQCGEL